MNWYLLDSPQGFNKDSCFPDTVMESISIDLVVECAYFSVAEYLQLYADKPVMNLQHFKEHSSDELMTLATNETAEVLGSLYALDELPLLVMRKLCDAIAPAYDKLKDNLFYALTLTKRNINEPKNAYLTWISPSSFVIIEENERTSIDGINLSFPFMTDLIHLGVSH